MEKPRSSDDTLTAGRKKPYRRPRLVDYGDLRKITMTKGSNRSDGAEPATRK